MASLCAFPFAFPQSRAESWPRGVCEKMGELLRASAASSRCPVLCAVFRKEKVETELANPDLCEVLEVDLLVQPNVGAEPGPEKQIPNGFIQPSLVDQLVFLGLAQYNRDIGAHAYIAMWECHTHTHA